MISVTILSKDPKLKNICSRYWSINSDGEFTEANTKQICQDFDLTNYQLTKIIQEYSAVTSETHKCGGCNEPWKITSRTHYKDVLKRQGHLPLCDSCKQNERNQIIEQARLSKMQSQKNESLARDKLISINSSRPPFCLESLEFKGLVFLKTILDHSGSESLESINPFKENPGIRIAPGDMLDTILSYLKDEDVILIDPDSKIRTYFLDEDGDISYSISSVIYKVNFDKSLYYNGAVLYKAVTDLLGSSDFFKAHERDSLELSEHIMMRSLLEYMLWMIEEHNLVFSPGEKTFIVLYELIQEYSISEGMNIIFAAVKNAAAYAMKSNVSRKQASNSIIGTIQKRLERLSQEDLGLKKFQRNYNFPQTTIERVLFSKVFKGDDVAFDLSLNQQKQMLEKLED